MRFWFASKKPPKAPKLPDEVQEEPGDEEGGDPDETGRRHYVVGFRRSRDETLGRVTHLTGELESGELDSQEWATEFRRLLADAHSHAHAIGRSLAGDVGPFGRADVEAGEAAWAEQDGKYFAGFLADLERKDPRYVGADGSLNVRAFDARARSYVAATKGTANCAFRGAMGKDVLRWVLGPSDHCKPSKDFEYDCPSLAEEEPRPADEWPTEPGGGKTPCSGHCTCHFESEGGEYSTEGL